MWIIPTKPAGRNHQMYEYALNRPNKYVLLIYYAIFYMSFNVFNGNSVAMENNLLVLSSQGMDGNQGGCWDDDITSDII